MIWQNTKVNFNITDLEIDRRKTQNRDRKSRNETLNRFFSSALTLQDRSNIPSVENLGGKEQEAPEMTKDMVLKVITKLKKQIPDRIPDQVLYDL